MYRHNEFPGGLIDRATAYKMLSNLEKTSPNKYFTISKLRYFLSLFPPQTVGMKCLYYPMVFDTPHGRKTVLHECIGQECPYYRPGDLFPCAKGNKRREQESPKTTQNKE